MHLGHPCDPALPGDAGFVNLCGGRTLCPVVTQEGGEPVIRPADAGDVPALAILAERTWAEAFAWSVAPVEADAEVAKTRSEAYFRDALQADTILVAESGNTLVGYAQFGRVRIRELVGRTGAELHRVYVDAEFQNRGLGRRLVSAALRHPRMASSPCVYLQVWERNEGAVRFYERFGFRTVGRTSFTIGEGEVV